MHGTPVNEPTYRETNGSMAMQFNGTNHIFVGDARQFQISGSLSLEAIVRLDTYENANGTKQLIIFRGDNRAGLDPFRLNIRRDGHLRFISLDANNIAAAVNSPDASRLNQFVHVVATLADAAGEMRLYLNLELVDATNTNVRAFTMLDPN